MTLNILSNFNRCQLERIGRAGRELDPSLSQSCEVFRSEVKEVDEAIRFTYKFTAFASLREWKPEVAAEQWKDMVKLCEDAMRTLVTLKELYPACGTPELYSLALDYRKEAEERYLQNLQDAKCAKMPVREGLFPKAS